MREVFLLFAFVCCHQWRRFKKGDCISKCILYVFNNLSYTYRDTFVYIYIFCNSELYRTLGTVFGDDYVYTFI